MKKFISAVILSAILLSFSACYKISVTENPDPTVPETAESKITVMSAENSTTAADTKKPYETEIYPLDLLNYYIDDEGKYRVNQDTLKISDDYDLFRKYFFGTWEGGYHFADDDRERESLVIDDSDSAYNMTDPNVWFCGSFYEVNDNVLAFLTGGISGCSIHWININNPDTMYIAWGGVDELNWLWSREKDGSPSEFSAVYTLTKTDAPISEPEENFLSIYKLLEMSRDYGINLEMLTDITFTEETDTGILSLCHDAYANFFPVYLVSQSPDKLELKTQVGNAYIEDSEKDVSYTIEKINGEWIRTVMFH